jgi:large subunit ribosomal protein L29
MALAELQDEQLIKSLLQNERDLLAMRMRHSMNQLENTSQLRNLRKDIARMHTEARRREAAQGLSKDSLLHTHRRAFTPEIGDADQAPAEKGGFLSGIVDKLSGKE